MPRRSFICSSTAGARSAVLAGVRQRAASCAPEASPKAEGPYGPLQPVGPEGVAVPAGFTCRVVARSEQPVGDITWHAAPDGGACFAAGEGWIYVSNSQLPLVGGVSALRFGPDGRAEDAYRILSGTNLNGAGAATPWQTWLSCEEIFRGLVYETDPTGRRAARSLAAMGRFSHGDIVVDAKQRAVYMTEMERDGCFYRFRPDIWGELSRGRLDVLCSTSTGVEWRQVPDPAPGPLQSQIRAQVDSAWRFDKAEVSGFVAGRCRFTTDSGRVAWEYDAEMHSLRPTGATGEDSRRRRLGGSAHINVVGVDGAPTPIARVDGHHGSQITGPAFSPDGARLYFSSQRGSGGGSAGTGGVTFEVTGPFDR